MSRSEDRRLRLAAFGLAMGILLSSWGAGAQSVSSPQVTGVELTAPVRQTLKQIEEQWLRLNVENDPQQARHDVESLLETAHQLGMARLPDLSAAALARGVQAARQKDFARAQWALEAAERFDPGRPETAFAEATVNRLRGDWTGTAGAWLRAFPRIFAHPLERYLWFQDLLFWTLILLLVTGGLFVAVQMLTKGSYLFQDLASLFGRRLPRPVALAAAILVLIWPVVLPGGPLWVVLYWSLLLWGYGSISERVVMIFLWLLLGIAPPLIDLQQRHVAVALSPPSQAVQSLEEQRLYGNLFADLGVLRSVLPESVAVKQLLADFHRSLNQWELARPLYREVLAKEPDNAPVLINLGAYFFLKGDFNGAIQNFQKAAEKDPNNAAAHYNLSQSFSDSYMFDEQRAALNRAQALDAARVNAWMRGSQRVVTLSGGMDRIPEIRRELMASLGGEERTGRALLLRRGLPLFVALSLVLVAAALHLARRPFGYTERTGELIREGAFDRWARIFLPGMASAEIGEGGKAFFALLLPMALLMLPLFADLGVHIPWRYDSGNLVSRSIAILGLALFFGIRLRRELHDEV